MEDYIIRLKNGFALVPGYKVAKQFICYKSENNDWVISDLMTGLRLKEGYSKYSDCIKSIKETDWTYLDEYKKDSRYIKAVSDLNNWKINNI